VNEAAVVMRDRGGDRGLVAYTVMAAGGPGATELRQALLERLPHYMVPSVVVVLAAMPRTPSGKLDRRQLPAPDRAASSPDTFVAPRGAVEATLAGIFCDLLGLETVSVDDDFFDLGGHSLLAVRLMTAVEASFGVSLPVRTTFEAPTIAELASLIDKARPPTRDGGGA
jgi:acyl carrier protein